MLPSAPTHPLLSVDTEVAPADQQNTPSVANPYSSQKVLSYFSSITQRTPKSKTPIQPSEDEMHPHHRQKSTTPYDEARWLGFFSMGPHTEPPRAALKVAPASPSPIREVVSASHGIIPPEFNFAHKRQSLELSPGAQKIMAETREEAAKIRARMSILPPVPQVEPGAEFTGSPTRKMAKPKGKVSRFSDAHMAEFKKMDSIANHPSAWRADLRRLKETTKPLKRSPSKADLDKPETNPFATSAPSVASVDVGVFDADITPSKRVKINRYDDASSKKVVHSPSKASLFSTPKSVPAERRKTGLPRSLSSLMSPTKASIARSQSVKPLKTAIMIQSPARSNSTKSLRSPFTPRTKITTTVPNPVSPTPIRVTTFIQDSPVKAPTKLMTSFQAADPNITPKIKSILRRPYRLYSNDPAKIAAGTHLATPPHRNLTTNTIPYTAPPAAKHQKRVDFTSSALAKAARDETKAASFETEAVRYPSLDNALDSQWSTISSSPIPGSFTFQVGTPVVFGPLAGSPTIRAVRESCGGAGEGVAGVAESASVSGGVGATSAPKRKRAAFLAAARVEKFNEKENRYSDGDEADDERPAKRMKRAPAVSPRADEEKRSPLKLLKKRAGGRLPVANGGKGSSGLTVARLNMLAMPKRRA